MQIDASPIEKTDEGPKRKHGHLPHISEKLCPFTFGTKNPQPCKGYECAIWHPFYAGALPEDGGYGLGTCGAETSR